MTPVRSGLSDLRRLPWAGALALGLLVFAGPAEALAAATGTSNSFKGFGGGHDPIQIEADNLGVVSPDQVVTITGNVTVKQKETTLYTQTLKVFYEQANALADAAKPADPAKPADAAKPADPSAVGQNSQLRRFEASGGVKITQPDQTVTGESGWFDMASQKAEVEGHVVLTQCKNVAKGSKLLINLKTGEYRLEGEGKRIQILIDNQPKGQGSNDTKCR